MRDATDDQPNYNYTEVDGAIYRTAKWERGGRIYSERSLVGSARSISLEVSPDTVIWFDDAKIQIRASMTRWESEVRDFKSVPVGPGDVGPLVIRIEGRDSPLGVLENWRANQPVDLREVVRLSGPPLAGLVLEIASEVVGFANIPATIVLV